MSEENPNAFPEGDLTTQRLRQWHEGDREALDSLLRQFMPELHRYASSKLGEKLRWKEETADVIQDAIINFMTYGPPFLLENRRQFLALLKKIVDNVLLGQHQWFQRMRRKLDLEQPLPEGTKINMCPLASMEPTPSRVVSQKEQEGMLRLALETLDAVTQRIVSMRMYEEASFPVIGTALGMTEDAVRKRFNRALPLLSKKVQMLERGEIDAFLE